MLDLTLSYAKMSIAELGFYPTFVLVSAVGCNVPCDELEFYPPSYNPWNIDVGVLESSVIVVSDGAEVYVYYYDG